MATLIEPAMACCPSFGKLATSTSPMLLVPAGRAGRLRTSTSPMLLAPAGSAASTVAEAQSRPAALTFSVARSPSRSTPEAGVSRRTAPASVSLSAVTWAVSSSYWVPPPTLTSAPAASRTLTWRARLSVGRAMASGPPGHDFHAQGVVRVVHRALAGRIPQGHVQGPLGRDADGADGALGGRGGGRIVELAAETGGFLEGLVARVAAGRGHVGLIGGDGHADRAGHGLLPLLPQAQHIHLPHF